MPAIFSFRRGKTDRATVLRVSLLGTAVMSAGAFVVLADVGEPVQSVAAAVAVPHIVAVSPERGYIYKIMVGAGDHVEAGQTLITVKRRADPRSQIEVTSPCSCQVIELKARHGAETIPGEALVYLTASPGGDPVVEAVFPADVALAVGDMVEVSIEGVTQAVRGGIRTIGRGSEVVNGLPDSFLDKGPDQQLVVVGEVRSLPGVRPGDAAIVRLSRQVTLYDRIRQAVLDLFA